MQKKNVQGRSIDADGNYVDVFGKTWSFFAETKSIRHLKNILRQNKLCYKPKTKRLTQKFYCVRCIQAGKKNGCRHAMLYVPNNGDSNSFPGSLFVRGAHSGECTFKGMEIIANF